MTLLLISLLALGVLLTLAGQGIRSRRGLTPGRTLDLDGRTLHSARYGLTGCPDRIVEGSIPEEWKSSLRVHDSHRAQLAVYLILIEEETRIQPPHGFIVTGDGEQHEMANSGHLRMWVLDIAEQIRAARRQLDEPIRVSPPAAKCRACGMRGGCGQRRE